MRIIEPLPHVDGLSTRAHAQPSRLPRYDDEAAVSRELSDYILDYVSQQSGYATCLAEALFPQGCARFCRYKPWDYLELLLVCKHWRSVIEAFPRFWSDVVVHNEVTVAKSLELSGATPLKVVVDEWIKKNWPSEHAFTSVLEQLHRVGTLEVELPMRDQTDVRHRMENILNAFASSPAPLLQTLRWTCRNKQIVSTHGWVEQSFPALQVLALYDVDLRSPSPFPLLAPTLTQLTLSRCSPPWRTAAGLFLILDRMPLLETLFLWSLPEIPDFEVDHFQMPNTPEGPISLPHLRILNLEGSYRYVFRLLRKLSIPPDLSILNLSCVHEQYGLDLLNEAGKTYAFFDALAQAIPDGEDFTCLEYKVGIDSEELEASISGNGRRFHWRQEWDINDYQQSGDVLAFIRRICQPFFTRFTFSDLRITVTGSFDGVISNQFNAHTCFGWLQALDTLAALHLASDAAAYVIPWMRQCMHSTEDGELAFPHVSRVVISETSLVETATGRALYPFDIPYVHLWLYLHDKRPIVILQEVELTHRMHKYLLKMLGPWLKTGGIEYVEGPRVRMEVSPSRLFISIPPHTEEMMIDTPYGL